MKKKENQQHNTQWIIKTHLLQLGFDRRPVTPPRLRSAKTVRRERERERERKERERERGRERERDREREREREGGREGIRKSKST